MTEQQCDPESMEVNCTVYTTEGIDLIVLPYRNETNRILLNLGNPDFDMTFDNVRIRATLFVLETIGGTGLFDLRAVLTVEPAVEALEFGCTNGLIEPVMQTIFKYSECQAWHECWKQTLVLLYVHVHYCSTEVQTLP